MTIASKAKLPQQANVSKFLKAAFGITGEMVKAKPTMVKVKIESVKDAFNKIKRTGLEPHLIGDDKCVFNIDAKRRVVLRKSAKTLILRNYS